MSDPTERAHSPLVEVFREALMREHHHDWDMETVAEAAYICAAQLEQTTGCEECGDRPLPGAYGVPENPCGLCGSPELFKRRTRAAAND